MKVQVSPRDVVRAMVSTDYSALDDSIEIVREKHAGEDAAFAVTFADLNGVQRQGVFGLRKHPGGTWRPSGGGYLGSAHQADVRDVWITCGGWGGASHARAVYGGWVADPTAVSARATDLTTGRVLEEVVENGVVIFMYRGDFTLTYARLDLLDAGGQVMRTGPLRGRP